jgi:hypothetical protein
MHQKIKNTFAMFTIASIGLCSSVYAATPAEKTAATLTRTAASGVQITESLTKNIFRRESSQVPYTVQEPYETTETYTEQVPYQDTETYYEDVPYQDTETYQDSEDYTDNEYRCETRTRDERVCHDQEDCHIVPGRGDDGGPRKECTTSPACENVSRPYQDCGNVSVRKTRPVTRTRTVTKYRQEQRTRTVTKYRSEQRTRTVTKYRDKEVCCKTVTKDTFDHQQTLSVVVNFPADTALQGAEKESFTLEIAGDEAAPAVTFKVKDAVFGYSVAQAGMHGGAYEIDLARAPLYTPEQLGAATIKALTLQESAAGSSIRFKDEGLRARIDTAYSYQIHAVGATDMLATGNAVAKDAQVVIPVTLQLEEMKEYQVDVRVVRQGLPLSANVDVTVSAVKKITPLKNTDVYMKKDNIKHFEIKGEGKAARLFFQDATPSDEGVKTTYKLELLAGSSSTSESIFSKELNREDLPLTEKGFFRILLADTLGISEDVLKAKVRVGKPITILLTATRENGRLNNGEPVVLKYKSTETVEKE